MINETPTLALVVRSFPFETVYGVQTLVLELVFLVVTHMALGLPGVLFTRVLRQGYVRQ